MEHYWHVTWMWFPCKWTVLKDFCGTTSKRLQRSCIPLRTMFSLGLDTRLCIPGVRSIESFLNLYLCSHNAYGWQLSLEAVQQAISCAQHLLPHTWLFKGRLQRIVKLFATIIPRHMSWHATQIAQQWPCLHWQLLVMPSCILQTVHHSSKLQHCIKKWRKRKSSPWKFSALWVNTHVKV